ncbi:hypothetical protein ALC57_01746 [Trachymyrmex cornetzi]|uniref:Uncharacterized protein n=1 Tax=Trachymyrmex cornetzi TaxID=471704 RepID=A0A195EKL5_9HYME|nr:hypothetical protein ALC57_01746 [Trachymyrmex cornetzi]
MRSQIYGAASSLRLTGAVPGVCDANDEGNGTLRLAVVNRIWILLWQFEVDFPYASKKVCISQSQYVNPTRQDKPGQSNFYHHIERMPATKQARRPSRGIGLLYLSYLLQCPNCFDRWTRASLRRGTGAMARDGGSISNYKRRRTFSSRYVTVGVENDRAASGESTAPMRSVTRCNVQRRELLYSQY